MHYFLLLTLRLCGDFSSQIQYSYGSNKWGFLEAGNCMVFYGPSLPYIMRIAAYYPCEFVCSDLTISPRFIVWHESETRNQNRHNGGKENNA